MARILYINHYAGSEKHGMEFRPFYMSREWGHLGHDVTIVAASQSHLRQQNPEVTAAWNSEVVSGVRYIWLRTPKYVGNGLGRVLNILAFVLALYKNARRLAVTFKPDIVIASSTYPFDAYPAKMIAKRARAAMIFEVHDLWPMSPMELGGMSPRHPFIVVTQAAEDFVCRAADFVVSMLPKADRHLVSRGMAPEKFVYVPNGIVLDEWISNSRNGLSPLVRSRIDAVKAGARYVVMYAGAHGLLNNLAVLLDAAALLRSESIAFVLVGHGPEKEKLVRLADSRELANVHFLDSVPKSTIPALLGEADCLFISFAPQPLFRFGVSPNKLMDYMMAGKPIVAAMNAGNNIVEEHECGLTVEPDDARGVANAFLALMRASPEVTAGMGQRGQLAVRSHYAYGPLAARFAELFERKPSAFTIDTAKGAEAQSE